MTQVYKESIHSVNVNYSVKRPGILYKLKAIDMIWIKRDRYTIMTYILPTYTVYFEQWCKWDCIDQLTSVWPQKDSKHLSSKLCNATLNTCTSLWVAEQYNCSNVNVTHKCQCYTENLLCLYCQLYMQLPQWVNMYRIVQHALTSDMIQANFRWRERRMTDSVRFVRWVTRLRAMRDNTWWEVSTPRKPR